MTTGVMDTYARLPVTFERGDGAWLWDDTGQRYLDALSGIAVCGLGHAHPAVARAVADQAGRLVHTSNLYRIETQERLATLLTALAEMERVFFCNSGAEANEAAIKIARSQGHRKGLDQPEIVVAEGSFHGRTLATLSATGNRKVHAGFEPLVQGFVRVPYDDLDAVRGVARSRPGIVGILIEPILGEGGVVIPHDGYLGGLRRLCDEHEWLLMVDEVQTGVGRTGRWFAYQHAGIHPDVVTVAKSLGNGVPIGACLARGAAAQALPPGSHGSTFGGNPLACRAATSVIETIEADGLLAHAHRQGERLKQALTEALGGLNCVVNIRGKGMMIGIELDRPCAELVRLALERRLLINVTAERVVRLLPPLILDEEQLNELVTGVSEIIRSWNAGS